MTESSATITGMELTGVTAARYVAGWMRQGERGYGLNGSRLTSDATAAQTGSRVALARLKNASVRATKPRTSRFATGRARGALGNGRRRRSQRRSRAPRPSAGNAPSRPDLPLERGS